MGQHILEDFLCRHKKDKTEGIMMKIKGRKRKENKM
jgi:hypothetical protein